MCIHVQPSNTHEWDIQGITDSTEFFYPMPHKLRSVFLKPLQAQNLYSVPNIHIMNPLSNNFLDRNLTKRDYSRSSKREYLQLTVKDKELDNLRER